MLSAAEASPRNSNDYYRTRDALAALSMTFWLALKLFAAVA